MGIGISLGAHHVTFFNLHLGSCKQLTYTFTLTVTIESKSYNSRINTCLSNTTGLHHGWDKIMQLKCVN